MTASATSPEPSTFQRYVQLAVLVVVGGTIYPLIYLRQNFEVTILESFGITATQIGHLYSMLGVMFVLTYIPSGWLADRVAPRILMSFSLAFAAILGIWFSTMPSFSALNMIFIGWGIATGLTFWSALIKATTMLAKSHEQGRFFGILDGGRGLVEAILATIAVGMFAYWLEGLGQAPATALRKVIWFYISFMLIMSPIVLFILKDNRPGKTTLQESAESKSKFLDDLLLIAKREEIWLCAFCILAGYQLFFATYAFSHFLQSNFGLSAVAVGTITVAKLWMRPIGAVAAGFAGDFLDRERVLGILLLLSSVALASLTQLSASVGSALLLTMVLMIGLLTYAVRGIFWATLESCKVPDKVKGLAIGMISLIGYSPDIYLPRLRGYLVDGYGRPGYTIYFGAIALIGVLGALAAWRLKVVVNSRNR